MKKIIFSKQDAEVLFGLQVAERNYVNSDVAKVMVYRVKNLYFNSYCLSPTTKLN
ncbi:MAG: hypothetical protein JST82_12990 [Bacteroidetes bacterium]|nr:hypothetical protein [Bacteroidota bacterium]